MSEAPSSFSHELRTKAGSEWTKIISDPVTDDFGAGKVPRAAMIAYLVQDHRFVDAFSILLASMLAKTTSINDRAFGAQFLAMILSKENTYFQRSFEELKVEDIQRTSTPNEAETTAFDRLLRSAANSNKLHIMLAVLLVAEWSYLEWAERIDISPNLPFIYQEWIDLHRGPYFQSVVSYLRNLLDKLSLTEDEREEATTAFLETVNAEAAFWAMIKRYY